MDKILFATGLMLSAGLAMAVLRKLFKPQKVAVRKKQYR